MFVEKYKPKTFGEIIGLDPSIPKLCEGPLPNFLFFGPAGTGKTTTARVITSTLKSDVLILNGSDERGIATIQEKVKRFVMGMSISGNKKIVILDEADGLTNDAQNALRGIIDKYVNNCAFILTCNFVHKIIDPLKSRCVCCEFKTPKKEDIKTLLIRICGDEQIEYDFIGLDNIIKETYPDIRSAIKEFETIYKKFDCVSNENTKNLKDKVNLIIQLLKERKILEAIKTYEEEYVDEEKIMSQIADEVFYGNYSIDIKKKVLGLIRVAYVQMNRVITKRLIMRPFLLSLGEVLK